MKRLLLYCLLVVSVALPAHAQEVDRDSAMTETLKLKNNIDITFGGSGLVISANYNRKLLVRPEYYLNASMGIGTVPASGGMVLPHQLSFNLGKRESYLEMGIAGTFSTGTSDASGIIERQYSYQLSPIIGYRRYFFNSMVFRAYLNPFIHIAGVHLIKDYVVIPYAGLSLGHAF